MNRRFVVASARVKQFVLPVAILAVLSAIGIGLSGAPARGATSSGASTATGTASGETTSYYESTTDSATLFAQGQAAGAAGAQGLVILDYGRPAVADGVAGTMDYSGTFDSLAAIGAATETYVQGYFDTAPSYLHLHVAIGTNDSCGPGQPCGAVVCGCTDEPPSFSAWGAQLAAEVEQVQEGADASQAQSGFTDVVTIDGGDDAEPAFDPEYQNTYDLLAGYAGAVNGYLPAMIDFGSADPGYWSEAQLLQVADGFAPDVAVPEIYSATDGAQWTALASYAASVGQPLTIFGVLTTASADNSPEAAYSSLAGSLQTITGQPSIQWFTNITP
jgi:hypothetical protein